MRSCLTLFKKREGFFLCCVFVLTLLLYLPQIFLREAILRDVALRYAPMAESFASGDFRYAFHPRVQSLHPLISGCICYLFDCSGFTAVQLSSLLFFGLCIFPLYNLLKTVFNRKIARWGILLLPLASQVAQISVSGLRESHKMFALLIITLGIVTVVKEREKYSGYLLTGIGCGLAFCIRIDLVLPSLCLLSAAGMMAFAAQKSLKRPLTGLLAVLPFFIFETAVNFYVSGHAVPGSHSLRFMREFVPWVMTPSGMCLAVVISAVCFAAFSVAGGYLLKTSVKKKVPAVIFITLAAILIVNIAGLLPRIIGLSFWEKFNLLLHFAESIVSGLNLPVFLTAALGFCVLHKQKKTDETQKILLLIFLFFIGATLFQTVVLEHKLYVSKRYLLPYSLLLAGWSVHGIVFCREKIEENTGNYSKILLKILWIILPLLCLFHAYSNLLEYKFERDKKVQLQTLKTISTLIKSRYSGPAYFTPAFSFFEYRGNRCPKIAFISPGKACSIAYSSGGSFVRDDEKPDFFVAPAGEKFSEKKWRKIAENLPFGKNKLNVWELKK
jgi:hypothetical protein